MHLISDLGGPGMVPARPPGTRLVASVDVEWSKNYRIKDGNRAFCYSIVWLAVPASDQPVQLTAGLPFWSTSLYLDRTSPFVEETVIHGKGVFDLPTEVDLYAAQLSATLRAARHHHLLFCDKTVVNVLTYARMVLPAPPGSQEAAVLDAMAGFCRAWAPATYDAVFYLPDRYEQPADPMRARVSHLQEQTADAVRDTCADVGLPLVDVPAGPDVAARVAWIARRVDPMLTEATR